MHFICKLDLLIEFIPEKFILSQTDLIHFLPNVMCYVKLHNKALICQYVDLKAVNM
jgi:hypothetical protein